MIVIIIEARVFSNGVFRIFMRDADAADGHTAFCRAVTMDRYTCW